jgi:hypothetical protein
MTGASWDARKAEAGVNAARSLLGPALGIRDLVGQPAQLTIAENPLDSWKQITLLQAHMFGEQLA